MMDAEIKGEITSAGPFLLMHIGDREPSLSCNVCSRKRREGQRKKLD